MRIITTKIHGVMDYLVGVLLVVSPWLFQFYRNGAETWVPVALGAGALIYSFCTDYELGGVKAISVPVHLNLDIFSGIFLATSPWMFGFSPYIYLPHLVIGIAEIGIALFTEKTPYRKQGRVTNLKSEKSVSIH